MAIFTDLMRALGLQRCTLDMEGLPTKARSGGDLHVHVVLRAGARALRVRELRVCLEEERLIYLDPAGGAFAYWDTVVRSVVPLPRVRLAPREAVRVPVHLPLPELEPSDALRRYRLRIVAAAPGIPPRTSALVRIVESAATEASVHSAYDAHDDGSRGTQMA